MIQGVNWHHCLGPGTDLGSGLAIAVGRNVYTCQRRVIPTDREAKWYARLNFELLCRFSEMMSLTCMALVTAKLDKPNISGPLACVLAVTPKLAI